MRLKSSTFRRASEILDALTAAVVALAPSPSAASGVITEFLIPTSNSSPQGIVAGPDGNIWLVESGGNKIARVTPSGLITEFALPGSGRSPEYITAGPDGNLWFTERIGNNIGRITPEGTVTEFPLPTPDSGREEGLATPLTPTELVPYHSRVPELTVASVRARWHSKSACKCVVERVVCVCCCRRCQI